jgi:hypothetical protein
MVYKIGVVIWATSAANKNRLGEAFGGIVHQEKTRRKTGENQGFEGHLGRGRPVTV